jgi:arylsulfatase A-like enzyme
LKSGSRPLGISVHEDTLRRAGFGAAAICSRAVHESAVYGITEGPWRRRKRGLGSPYAPVSAAVGCETSGASTAKGQPVSDKPNVLIIWGDDIGQSNLSCYSNGLMGYRTPNIDRVAAEGVLFTDYYAEQSCTAGRAAFITGQNPYRTGLTKVGLPGAPLGLQAQDPTIATALKAQGYATGQFGKNHLGDRDEHLPTMHGFDEFFGNLYHLNAEEEPELPDYPKDPEFRKKFGPRGVLHTWANGDGTQRIEDTGPLTKKRMETCDGEFRDAAVDFIKRQHEAETPFFVWFNTTHMHFRTHTEPGSVGRAGRWQSRYHDTMLDHDDTVGSLLDLLDELGIAENTIVMYSTDNGPHMNSWPDAGMTPFRNEKNSNWEGAYRVPALVRWPGHIPAGSVLNGIVSHADWFVTLLSAAGVPDIAERLRAGTDLNGTTYKVHLDGHDQLAYITGETDESPRNHFFYVSDDGDLTALRFDNWKFVFLEQRCAGTMQIWAEPYVELRVPKLFNLRTDPYERADITSNTYYDWMVDHIFLFVPAQAYVAKMLETLVEFPQRQKSASFSMDQVMAKLQDATTRSS